jgi:hypothetical protein
MRDCAIIKKLLRWTGHDQFDDFELMVLVHEALFEQKEKKMVTVVRVTAGAHQAKTDPNSNGVFQQPLLVQVGQGTERIIVDLLDKSDRVIATLPLDTFDHVLGPNTLQPEMIYTMKTKGKGIRNPKIKLTMVVQTGKDVEAGLLASTGFSGLSSDLDILVRQQLKKARDANDIGDGAEGEGISEMTVLQNACSGPLELFEGLGNTSNVYAAVLGPPTTRRWVLGVWHDKRDYDAKKLQFREIELLKIMSVQADPSRHHVFMIIHYDASHVRQTLTFRRIDRARDVWVEILHLIVKKAHEQKKAMKEKRADRASALIRKGSQYGTQKASKQ